MSGSREGREAATALPVGVLRRRPEPLETSLQQSLAVGVAVQSQIPSAEDCQQRVVEAADGTRWIPVTHPSVHRCAVHGGEQPAEFVERRDAQLEEQARNPCVMVGPGPTGIRVLTGEERGELLGADPWVADVRLRLLVGDGGL